MKLELTEDELGVLVELIDAAVSELGYEIANTDSADYRSGLKSKKVLATAILQRLKEAGK